MNSSSVILRCVVPSRQGLFSSNSNRLHEVAEQIGVEA